RANSSRRKQRTQETAAGEEVQNFCKRDIEEKQLEFETERKTLMSIQQEEATFKANIFKLEFTAK
ncbi:hypothetical protein TCAL_15508, partial [Tigriopus californicus]